MAKRRKRRLKTPERLNRAQPRVLKKRSILEPEIKSKKEVLRILSTLNEKVQLKQRQKVRKSRLLNIGEIITPSCKAKKAKARHDYFSMRKSGKGANRTNKITDRFNSRC